jgi:YD repeat-containing protein
MEKGNEMPTSGGAAVDTQPDTPEDGAIVDPGPASTSSGGPSGTITNPDGSTTDISRDEDGRRIKTTRYKDGNVTETRTHSRNEDGSITPTTVDGDGRSTEMCGDWAASTNPDGSGSNVTNYQDGAEIERFDKDGKGTGGNWASTDGSETAEWDADDNRTSQYTEADIITGERVPVTETYKDGVTTKSYADSQASTMLVVVLVQLRPSNRTSRRMEPQSRKV